MSKESIQPKFFIKETDLGQRISLEPLSKKAFNFDQLNKLPEIRQT